MAAWLNVNDYLRQYAIDKRTDCEQSILRNKEKTDNTFLAYALLNMEGFHTGPIQKYQLDWGEDIHVKDVRDFSKIHRAVGNLDKFTEGPNPGADGRTREVLVVLRPKDKQFRHIHFSFVKVLPKPDKRKGKAQQPKCRLVTRVRKETILVCDNNVGE